MILRQKTIIFFSALMFFGTTHSHDQQYADLIVFSYDRPLQLYALLESVTARITGLDRIIVIYRASDKTYAEAYHNLTQTFEHITFWYQNNPPKDFKSLTMYALNSSKQHYILFAVDDNIVTDYIDIPSAIALLQATHAYGFYFRLGTHLTYCYSAQQVQKVPPYQQVLDDVYLWHFEEGEWDWRYPHTVDMTLYRIQDIAPQIELLHFSTPNSLEGHWALKTSHIINTYGLFHEHTKIVNVPLNRVQTECPNINMQAFSPQELLTLFMQGKKIDIEPLFKINNHAAHMEYMPTFVAR
jgi:hypothetical protein